MKRPTIKAINFDLDTKVMKSLGLYPDGYKKLGNSLQKYGFEHRQGSGYVSKTKCNDITIVDVVEKITKENPWLQKCVNKLDVTNVGKQFDLLEIVQNVDVPKAEAQNVSQECRDFILNLPNKSRRQKGKQSSNEAEL